MSKYRHGDVIVGEPVALPTGAIKRETAIVAEGEATGHAHRLVNGAVWEDADALYIVAANNAALTHEEHARLPLAPTARGMAHPITIQREYDDEQEWRQVAD